MFILRCRRWGLGVEGVRGNMTKRCKEIVSNQFRIDSVSSGEGSNENFEKRERLRSRTNTSTGKPLQFLRKRRRLEKGHAQSLTSSFYALQEACICQTQNAIVNTKL